MDGVPDDFVGKSIYKILPDIREVIENRVKQILATGVGGQHEDCVKLSDGEHWFISFLQQVRDEDGAITAIQVISEDNTTHVQAKQELQKRESRYRQIVENAATPIMYHGLDGTILVINTVGARNLGGVPSGYIGKSIEELFPLQAVEIQDRITQVAESGVAFRDRSCLWRISLPEEWGETTATNLSSVFLGTKYVIPHMKDSFPYFAHSLPMKPRDYLDDSANHE